MVQSSIVVVSGKVQSTVVQMVHASGRGPGRPANPVFVIARGSEIL
jgi:hypothetical protein